MPLCHRPTSTMSHVSVDAGRCGGRGDGEHKVTTRCARWHACTRMHTWCATEYRQVLPSTVLHQTTACARLLQAKALKSPRHAVDTALITRHAVHNAPRGGHGARDRRCMLVRVGGYPCVPESCYSLARNAVFPKLAPIWSTNSASYAKSPQEYEQVSKQPKTKT